MTAGPGVGVVWWDGITLLHVKAVDCSRRWECIIATNSTNLGVDGNAILSYSLDTFQRKLVGWTSKVHYLYSTVTSKDGIR